MRLRQAHLGKQFWDARAQGGEASIKAACIHFQNAAGAFLKAQELCKEGKVAGEGDISLDALSILQQQMLGQAHECILTKALLGGRKSPLGPRIAFQVRRAAFVLLSSNAAAAPLNAGLCATCGSHLCAAFAAFGMRRRSRNTTITATRASWC